MELELPENAVLADLIQALGEKFSKRFYRKYISRHYADVALVNGKPVINPSYKLRNGDRIVFVTSEREDGSDQN